MADSPWIFINEIILKADNKSGKIIILKPEKESEASLSMFVGEPEFLAIAKEKNLIQTPRPLTHELYLSLLAETAIKFLRVEIYDLHEQAYLARVIYQLDGIENLVESRPSDALALALNRSLPIWVNPKLLKKELTPEQIEAYKELIKTVKF